ncbi:polysaccharide deacetylase family protein [Orenia marismortui]|uniref:Polysaccharide deacetylase n=1 Tax=Orenia marismortui TaxID=46469 RepID=A0A4R8GUK0_9FIRM|nr:polysaccharide deacetylase family protein [Orenia marismortui]TDX45517.1 polysaccharide deacetylase [Orenia marismortui]
MLKKFKAQIILVFVLLISLSNITYADGNILVFHRFDDQRYPSTSISNNRLREIFNYLKENNYEVVGLERLVDYIEKKVPIPEKMVAITIDDGYESFYENALEMFKNYNYPFTIFINTKAINLGYGDFLTWEQLREISKYGTIATHSYEHKHLTMISIEDLKKDINRSIVDIEDNLGIRPIFFSYPYGEYNTKIKNIIKNIGFKAIFNQNLGAVSENSDLYDIDRIAITNDSNLSRKLAYKYLDAKWLNVDTMVKNNKLRKIKIKLDSNIHKAEFYISGYGWQKVDITDGLLSLDFNKKLKYFRNRLFLKTYDNKITSKIIIVEDNFR